MARPTEKFDADPLPDPELNPLLNPVLGAHMGRWAEVYFTTPPERREQAVFELLRELGTGTSATASSDDVIRQESRTHESRTEKTEAREASELSRSAAEADRICPACLHRNYAEHNFCGMCGAPLEIPLPTQESNLAAPVAIPAFYGDAPQSYLSGDLEQYPRGRTSRSGYDGSNDLALPDRRLADGAVPRFAMESESVPYRYRLYIGAALALLFALLAYKVWFGTGGDKSVARTVPAAPAAPAAASPVVSNQARQPEVAPAPAPSTPQSPAAEPTQTQAESSVPTTQAPNRKKASPRIVSVAEDPSTAPATELGGEQEYATAEKYLNTRNPGAPRDNREAAEWLWKSVAKGNLAATMTLSDLYLRGDGIPQNCDQARLLLHAAARKGKAAAGERLRNLQAFGCS